MNQKLTEIIHNSIGKYRAPILFAFLILSLIFLKLGNEFKQRCQNVNCDEIYQIVGNNGMNHQPFSPSFKFVDNYEKYESFLISHDLCPLNGQLFAIDNIWAFFLILFLYSLVWSTKRTRIHTALILLLIMGYFFDFIENGIYLSWFILLQKYVSLIAAMKMTGYVLAGLLIIIILINKVKP